MVGQRKSPGWKPNQHGAWVMLAAPTFVGAVISGVHWRHGLLAAAWSMAYFAFFAIGLWLRSHLKARYLPPVRAYVIASAILAVPLLVAAPGLLAWGPVYAVLLAVSFTASWWREERTWWNDLATITAASIMTVVAAAVGSRGTPSATEMAWPWWPLPGAQTPGVAVAATVLFAYFIGTAWYVKTMIRERENPRVYWGSVVYHVVLIMPAFTVSVLLGATALMLAARAALVPRIAPAMGPAGIGSGEIVATVVVVASVLLAAPALN